MQFPKSRNKGFSIVELLIAMSIFAFLSTVSVLSYNNFNNRVGVDILAHQIAQFAQEARVSALSVKHSVGGSGTDAALYPGYGIHFRRASTTMFTYFADINNDKYFSPGGTCGSVGLGSECEKQINLLKGVTITVLCADTLSGTASTTACKTAGMPNIVDEFDVVFKRPSPDAIITTKNSGVPTSVSMVQVKIMSNKGYSRMVDFTNTGQISVR